MELDKRNIEEYINRFLEGETTNAEEQAIYRFFHTGDVPSHLMGYAPMFAWYEGGMQGEPGMSQPDGQEEVAGGKRSEKIPVVGKKALSAYSGNCLECRYSGNDGHCAGVRLDFLFGEPSRRKW